MYNQIVFWISSGIIDSWIWSVTWGVYQIPLSMLSTLALLVWIEKVSFVRAFLFSFCIYALATTFFWVFLFLPVHMMRVYEVSYSSLFLPLQGIVFLFAALFSCIQEGVIAVFNRVWPLCKIPNSYWVIWAANLMGSVLTLYFLAGVTSIVN